MLNFIGQTKGKHLYLNQGRTNMWKPISVKALLRKKSKMSQARDDFHMHAVDKNQNTNKTEEF
jgi:hypothetical protein